jgi:hypothetical protein
MSGLELDAHTYAPLPDGDFIRILELQPGSHQDMIRCTLEVEPFDTVEDTYEAISYAWGDLDETGITEIVCNKQLMTIGTNLADGLRQLRHQTVPRRLWADAICINQANKLEKGHQVMRMGQIYERAQQVLIWLGPDSEGQAGDCFDLISETVGHLTDGFDAQNIDVFNDIQDYKIRNIDRICTDPKRWAQVGTMLHLSWFRRVWVCL